MDLIPEFLQAKYDNVELIGEGGYARVYKCERAGVITAVKILFDRASESRTRFQGEINTLRRIDHENVVKVFAADETDGHYWYEMEYASQGDFGKMHSYLFYSDLGLVIKYFSQICLGVQASHDLDPPIIHRDLKPSNILVFKYLDPEQRTVLKIADFGLEDEIGTQVYTAPEPVKTSQSDIYSLGVTFFEACTGRKWNEENPQENLNLAPDLLKPIIPVIEKMVRPNPGERYQKVRDVLEALNSFSFSQLLYGKELQEKEWGTLIYRVHIGRELENARGDLIACNSDNVLERLAVLERTLDRLGDNARGHEAHTIMSISRSALSLIEKVNSEALRLIVQRFNNAVEDTTDRDHFSPSPKSWSRFLADTFDLSSYFPTKSLCLEGLANLLARFGSPGTKHYLYRTIESIKDPNDMKELARCLRLRGVDREDIASLLDGVPDQRDLDSDALRSTLGGAG